ncbi:hypothetical protein BV25DRAFT_1810326 [Artomyces pyxidatus]|uniref:Uncharacterized protein n=1 Tax=Artomyces pyxidatus TaxID=48021 RepID=A0ACB8SQ00_9AGAM|nr:hypothetical protein BV25DRAFT_1810326 [Artomyces pyxidatus]
MPRRAADSITLSPITNVHRDRRGHRDLESTGTRRAPNPMPSGQQGHSGPPSDQNEQQQPSSASYGEKALQDDQPRAADSGPVDAPFLNGQMPTSNRPKARDYEPDVAKLIGACVNRYESRISTQNPYPEPDEQIQWVREAWASECGYSGVDYMLTSRIMNIIKSGGSHIRGALKDKIRPLIAPYYDLVKNPSKRVAAKNREQLAILVDNLAFMCKDPKTHDGFAEAKILAAAIQDTWFLNKQGDGVMYHQYFNPIPDVTMALVFSTVEFCLGEWSTGKWVSGKYTEKDHKKQYKSILREIREWSHDNKAFLTNLGKKLYQRSRRNAGAGMLDDNETARLSAGVKQRVRQALVGRTGETDSEVSDADGEGGIGGTV